MFLNKKGWSAIRVLKIVINLDNLSGNNWT